MTLLRTIWGSLRQFGRGSPSPLFRCFWRSVPRGRRDPKSIQEEWLLGRRRPRCEEQLVSELFASRAELRGAWRRLRLLPPFLTVSRRARWRPMRLPPSRRAPLFVGFVRHCRARLFFPPKLRSPPKERKGIRMACLSVNARRRWGGDASAFLFSTFVSR